jgi:hypothetical protein
LIKANIIPRKTGIWRQNAAAIVFDQLSMMMAIAQKVVSLRIGAGKG